MKRFGIALLAGMLLFFGFACSPKPVELTSQTSVQEISGLQGLTFAIQQNTYYLDEELVAILVTIRKNLSHMARPPFLSLRMATSGNACRLGRV